MEPGLAIIVGVALAATAINGMILARVATDLHTTIVTQIELNRNIQTAFNRIQTLEAQAAESPPVASE